MNKDFYTGDLVNQNSLESEHGLNWGLKITMMSTNLMSKFSAETSVQETYLYIGAFLHGYDHRP